MQGLLVQINPMDMGQLEALLGVHKGKSRQDLVEVNPKPWTVKFVSGP